MYKCPDCGNDLEYDNNGIDGGGKSMKFMVCGCGYSALVKEITDSDNLLNSLGELSTESMFFTVNGEGDGDSIIKMEKMDKAM